MLRQEKQSKEVRPSRLAKSPPTPEEGGEKPSRRAPATAHANIQDYSFQTRQFRGRRIKGDGGLTVLLNRSTRPTPVSANLFRTPVSQNFLIMETSTGFGAEDAKLHFTRSLSTAGLGFEKQPLRLERPPAPLLHHCLRCASQSAAPRCPSTRGHLLPDPGRRNPAEADCQPVTCVLFQLLVNIPRKGGSSRALRQSCSGMFWLVGGKLRSLQHLFQTGGPLVANCEWKSWPLRKKPGSDRPRQLTAEASQGPRSGKYNGGKFYGDLIEGRQSQSS
ncbi:uncharacterized protein LOC120581650 [Pteropus medius]|uniref:uncharacterized protein LOC120581650 n=1 Tax=Pteropus vampyrus TaxID=132908 RepID=UPI00196AD0FB|nr:uncharacterized protein LOC120581650 [Pteropus giganteus]